MTASRQVSGDDLRAISDAAAGTPGMGMTMHLALLEAAVVLDWLASHRTEDQ